VEALQCDLYDSKGKSAGSASLNPEIFATEVNQSLVQQTVRWQLAKRRAGTHSVLSRSMMNASGKKPFKQKGTGRARQGSSVSPLMVGGAVVHGPQPRDYEFKVPKNVRRKALMSVLADKYSNGKVLVIKDFNLDGKTKSLVEILKKIKLSEQSILIVSEQNEMLSRSASNLQNITVLSVSGVNVYDLLKRQYLLLTESGLSALVERLSRNTEEKASESAA